MSRKKPIYVFNGLSNTGIFRVPIKSQVLIVDAGQGYPVFVNKMSHGQLDATSTIDDFLRSPELYKFISINIDRELPFEDSEILVWSAVNNKWIHKKNKLGFLNDVDLTGLQDKNFLLYNSGIGLWVPSNTLDGGIF